MAGFQNHSNARKTGNDRNESGLNGSTILTICTGSVMHTASTLLSSSFDTYSFIMVALWNRADHYIFMLWFVLSSSSSFSSSFFSSPNLSRRRLDVCHTSTHANLGCRSETCCTRLAGNAGRKKSSKSRHLRTIVQLCRAISSQLRHVSTI